MYSESAVVAKRCRLICAIYFLPTTGDIKRYHHLRTVISLVSGFFLNTEHLPRNPMNSDDRLRESPIHIVFRVCKMQ